MWEIFSSGLPPQHLVIHPSDPPTSHNPFTEEQLIGQMLEGLEKEGGTGEEALLFEVLHTSTRFLSSFPTNADGWHLRGLALMALGEERHLPDATACIAHSTTLRPDVSFYQLNLAESLIRRGLPLEAQAALYRCLELDPTDITAATRLQSLLLDAGARAEETALYTQLRPYLLSRPDAWSHPETSRFLQLHAMALAGLDRYAEAAEVLSEAVERFPSDHKAALRLGSALEGAGAPNRAIEAFLSAVQVKNWVEFRAGEGTPDVLSESRGRPRLAIYCDEYGQSWWGDWGPSSLGKGLGGSEEAVIFISRYAVC